MGYRFAQEFFSGFAVDLELDFVVVLQFFFGHGVVCLVVDDEEVFVEFQKAVHDALEEDLFSLFAFRIEGAGGEEDGEGHFFFDVFGFFHFFRQWALGEGEEGLYGIVPFPVGEEDGAFFFGEDFILYQLLQGGADGVFRRGKLGEIEHFHGFVHEGTEGGALIFFFFSGEKGWRLGVVGREAFFFISCQDGGGFRRFVAGSVFR